MGIHKIINAIKSRFDNGVVINDEDSRIVKYLKTAAGPRLTAIAAIVITKDSFRMMEGVFGKHDQLVGRLIPTNEQDSIKDLLDTKTLTIAAPEGLGYVVIEMIGPINGGYSAIYCPDDMNDYQIDKLEYFNSEVNKYNESCDNDSLKAGILIKDPETGHGTNDLTDVINKLRNKNRTK